MEDLKNTFLQDPVRIVLFDPLKKECKKIFIPMGNVKKNIHTNDNEMLKYYGKNYKKKLCIGNNPAENLLDWVNVTSTKSGSNDFSKLNESTLLQLIKTKEKVTIPSSAIKYDLINKPITSKINDIIVTDYEDGIIALVNGELIKDEFFDAYYITRGELKKGGDDFFDDISELLDDNKISPTNDNVVSTEFVDYNYNISLYPEDNFYTLKNKIFLMSNIPIYRQHLFYISAGRLITTYRIYIDGIYNVDIRNINSYESHVLGIPIDKNIYNDKDILKIEACDTFSLLSSLTEHTVYVVDLVYLIKNIKSQLQELIKDTYKLNLFYYGFIVKYWPMLTTEVFIDYINDESQLSNKYPDINQNQYILNSIYKTEREICDYNYNNREKFIDLINTKQIDNSITQAILRVSTQNVMLNIRNLFDLLQTTSTLVEIHAYVKYDGKNYILRKKNVSSNDEIQFPTGNAMKTDLIMALKHTKYIFINFLKDGRYIIKCNFNEEDEYNFDMIISYLQEHVNPIINIINTFGLYVFMKGTKLDEINHDNVTIQSLNMCIFWKHVISKDVFKQIRNNLESYIKADIINGNFTTIMDKYEFIFKKGIYEFDLSTIMKILVLSNNMKISNYYLYLYQNNVKQKWNQQYTGRLVKMSHRTVDIKFEIINITQNEFDICYFYIVGIIHRIINDPSIDLKKNNSNIKKLKKLKEEDPILFNLKKLGNNKVYSVICQNHRQPFIYTEDEIKNKTPAELKKLVKYWNFTMNKPAYYGCPDKKYPYLSFITGVHPKHYCLPCCNKKQGNIQTSSKFNSNKICLEKHEYNIKKQKVASRHIIGYDKVIDIGRLAKIPRGPLKTMFNQYNTKETAFYLFGVSQQLESIEMMGMFYSISDALSINLEELINMIIDKIKESKIDNIFNTILSGSLIEYFQSKQTLIDTLYDLFIFMKPIITISFPYWSEFIVEILHLMDICTFTITDNEGDCSNPEIYINNMFINDIIYIKKILTSSSLQNNKYIIIIKRKNDYYPIYYINPSKYFKNNQIEKKIFTYDDDIIKFLFDIVNYSDVSDKLVDLYCILEYCTFSGLQINVKYINKRNLCYAVLIDTDIYCSIDYSSYIPDNIPITFDVVNLKSLCKPEKLLNFIDNLNKYISNNLQAKYKQIKFKEYVSVNMETIAFKSTDNLLYYFNGPQTTFSADTDIPTTKQMYNYIDVNNAIMKRLEPKIDNRIKLIGSALYNNYQYQLFLLQCLSFFNTERNEDIRGKIISLINETDFSEDLVKFRKKLAELLIGYQTDESILNSQIYNYYNIHYNKEKLIESINNCIYSFDKISLFKLRKLEKSELKAQLKTMVSDLFIINKNFDTTNIKLSNVYVACYKTSDYCENGKLIITKDIDEYIDLLAFDILNDLKFYYLSNNIWVDIVVNWMDFISYPNEIISIYQV